jgi:hypothetical protein
MNSTEVERYKDISDIVLQNCKDRFPGNDVCTYWEFGKATLENTIEMNQTKYLQLTEQYNVSYLYHIRWDYFIKKNDTKKAQEAYARAIWLSNDPNEQNILKQKIEKTQ